jgi:hypothetical protein
MGSLLTRGVAALKGGAAKPLTSPSAMRSMKDQLSGAPKALEEIRERHPAEFAAEAEAGFEQVTIHGLHEYTKRNDGVVVLEGPSYRRLNSSTSIRESSPR